MYLGRYFRCYTGTDAKAIEKRVIRAKKVIGCLNGILWSEEINKKTLVNLASTRDHDKKYSTVRCLETWRITDKYKKKIEAVEVDVTRGKNR